MIYAKSFKGTKKVKDLKNAEKASTGASAFATDHQVEELADELKRNNDVLVRKQVVWPFIVKHGINELRAVTLPGAAPVWEYNLFKAGPEGISHLDYNFFLIEGDKNAFRTLAKHVKNDAGKKRLVEGYRELYDHCKKSNISFNIGPRPILLDEAFSHKNRASLPDNINMLYADLCGPWSNSHLRLLGNVNDSVDRFATNTLFGITVGLQRTNDAKKCGNVITPLIGVYRPDQTETDALSYSPEIVERCTTHHKRHCLGGADVVRTFLSNFQVELKFARVYRRYSEHNGKSQMVTLWFELTKNK